MALLYNLVVPMYTEDILEHYRHPHNFGILKHASHNITLYNPLCGDRIHLQVDIKHNTVQDVKFTGEGCAISTASASMLTDYVKGKKTGDLINIDSSRMMTITGISVSPGRIKCLLLPLEAIQKLLIQTSPNES